MQKLPTEINRGDFIYRQLRREGKYAIYEQILKDVVCAMPGESDKNITTGYEVIIIRRRKEMNAFGKTYPAREIYPSRGEWGKFGFTFNNFGDAVAKFKLLSE